MKRIWRFCVLVIPWLGFACFAQAADKFPVDFDRSVGEAELRVVHQDAGSLSLEATVTRFAGESHTLPSGRFLSLTLPTGTTHDIGRPELPALAASLDVPLGARDFKVEILAENWEEYRLADIDPAAERLLPTQPSVVKQPGASDAAQFALHTATYARDAFLPERKFELEDAGLLRGHRLVSLRLYPLRYNPATTMVQVCTRMDVRVTFEDADWNATARMRQRYDSPAFDGILQNVAANAGFTPSFTRVTPPLPIGYLMITPPSLATTLQPFADWKSLMGYDTTVVTTAQTGTTAAQIKSYIQTAYNTWPVPPTFVLLIGDIADIPAFTGSESGSVTDLDYCLMDSGNYFPDILLGRISVTGPSQLQMVLDKALGYEQVLWPDGTWIKDTVFMASTDNWDISEGTHNYVIDNFLLPRGYTCDKLYTHTYNATTQQVKDSLNDGRSLAVYSGHGYQTGWADGPAFDRDDILSLTNSDMFPFVFSHACLTGDYEVSESFAESWIRAPGKGGLIFWGASNNTYWDEDDVLEKDMFEDVYTDGNYHLSGMTSEALLDLYDHYGGAGLTQYYFQIYNIHGDPTLLLHTETPRALNVTHADVIPIGAAQISVQVKLGIMPVEDALVHLYKGTEVAAVGYTDFLGNLTLNVSPTTPGTMNIVVTAHNGIPYQDGILVIVPSGPYVVLNDYTADDTAGNNDGDIDIGETIGLPVMARNVGVESAFGVTATLTTTDPLVTITDAFETFGDLGPDATAWSDDDFDFDVDPFVADGHTVPFTVTFTDTASNSWAYDLSLGVNAPNMLMDSFTLADSGGDGIADPGETVDFNVMLLNDGHHVGENVSVTLHSADAYCTLTQPTATYADILPGNTGTNLSPFTAQIDGGCPIGHSVIVNVDIYRDGVMTDSDQFVFTVSKIPVLLIDLDETHSSAPAIEAALTALGISYEKRLNWPTDFSLHSSLFICLGMFSDNHQLSEAEANDVVAFMQAGGSVYMEGGDCWAYDTNRGIYSPYFGIDGTDDGTGDAGTIIGQPGTIAEGLSILYTGENSWVDHLSATGGAQVVLRNQTPSYGTGVARDAGTYKSIGVSFEFGGLADGAGGTKLEWMTSIVDFLLAPPPPPDHVLARAGTVNAGLGNVVNVLSLNGTAGDSQRRLVVAVGESVEVFMDAPPAGPNPARFALYAYRGENGESSLSPQPRNLGSMCFGTYMASSDGSLPFKVWNNIGKTIKLGEPNFPSSPAPSIVFRKGPGFDNPIVLTLQGFIEDLGTAADVPASVTNAVVLHVQ